MKRKFLVIAAVAVVLTHFSCSSQRGENKSNTSDSTNYSNPVNNNSDTIPPDTTKRDTTRRDSM